MEELLIVVAEDDVFEYVCPTCRQFRLFAGGQKFDGCGNCGQRHVIKGAPGALDKAEVLRELDDALETS